MQSRDTELVLQRRRPETSATSTQSLSSVDSTDTNSALSSEATTESSTTSPLLYQPSPFTKLHTTEVKHESEDETQTLPHSSSLDKIIIKSEIHSDDPKLLAQQIVTAFNKNHSPEDLAKVFTYSPFRGERVEQNEFLLAVRNSKAYLASYNRQLVALAINMNPTVTLKRISKSKLSDKYFGNCGSYILNVPVGMYAKVTLFNKPAILGQGVHVIHDPNFIFDKDKDFIDQNKDYIKHQTIHILRVKFGEIAKVTINSIPLLLEPQNEPYVFETPNFKFDGVEPATKNLIVYQSIKRVMPKNGEVAITNNGGTLETIKPGKMPRIINSPTHEVCGFLNTNRQTLLLPTDRTKKERAEEKRGDVETNLEIFRTSDSLEIGIKILVIYEITDPDLVLQNINFDMIIRHIEHTAVVDMGKAIQNHSSGDFLASSGSIKEDIETENKDGTKDEAKDVVPSAPILLSLQDEVMRLLSNDLKTIGIKLIRVNVESPTIIDKKIAEKMGEQSLTTAAANARQSTLTQETVIARSEAQRENTVAALKTDQTNALLLKSAQTKVAVAKQEAEALKIETKAKIDAQKEYGKLYTQYPIMADIRRAEILASALANAKLTITPGQFQTFLSAATNNPFGLFKPADVATTQGDVIEHDADEPTPDDSQVLASVTPSLK
jgi:regulator of protease activity HflC (stomatin/prohibitin superfamily)